MELWPVNKTSTYEQNKNWTPILQIHSIYATTPTYIYFLTP